MSVRIIVCGGRNYRDRRRAFEALDWVHARRGISEVIHGAASGADSLAAEWARERGIAATACPADWARYGKSAGPKRNREMLALKPDGVVAFPGGKGTYDMKTAAAAAGIHVYEVIDGAGEAQNGTQMMR